MNKASLFSIAGQGHVTVLDLTPFGQWLLGKSIIHNGLFLGGRARTRHKCQFPAKNITVA